MDTMILTLAQQNFEWIIPVIAVVIWIIGSIMKALQEKKEAERARQRRAEGAPPVTPEQRRIEAEREAEQMREMAEQRRRELQEMARRRQRPQGAPPPPPPRRAAAAPPRTKEYEESRQRAAESVRQREVERQRRLQEAARQRQQAERRQREQEAARQRRLREATALTEAAETARMAVRIQPATAEARIADVLAIPQGPISLRALTPAAMRQAVILREILDKPVAMRDPIDHSAPW